MHLKSLLIIVIAAIFSLQAFDWEYYLRNNKDLRDAGISTFFTAQYHFAKFGIHEKRKSTSTNFIDSNFNWNYYVEKNNLSCSNEAEALKHYEEFGKDQNLAYAKPITMIICLHLYNLDLAEEFIERINRFMSINDMNTYYIKITIPIAENITTFNHTSQSDIPINMMYSQALANTPYHKELVTLENSQQLFSIYTYLKNAFNINPEKVQIIFSENRGVDIGGFYLCMDQIIQQNLEHDFIMKIHSKTVEGWRKMLTSFMNVRINSLLHAYDCIYSCRVQYNEQDHILNKEDAETALRALKISLNHNFDYPAGTMFIASNKITDFYKNLDRLALFKLLNIGFPKYSHISLLEYGFEIGFGALFDYLQFKPFVIDYYHFSPYDELLEKNQKRIA